MKNVVLGVGAVAGLVFVPHIVLLGGAVVYTGAAVVNRLGKSSQV